MEPQRRDFLKHGSLAVISLAMLARTLPSSAQAKPLPHLAENDPQAAALGYRHDAKKVDKKKFANWQAGKDCDDCIQFVPGPTSEAAGSCKVVAGSISPHGYCLAFTPKPPG